MKEIQSYIKTLFFILTCGLILIGLALSGLTEKGDTVVWLNQLHAPIPDQFFKYYTYLGSGWVLLFLLVIFSVFKLQSWLLVVVTASLQGLIMLIFKVILFPKMPRPATYFEGLYDLQFVEGVNILYFRSFPSGHTMTAFGAAALLSILSNHRVLHLSLIIYAALVGVSRMYLAVHFLIDTVVGAAFGLITIGLAIIITSRLFKKANPSLLL